ncbi:hypothetical protein Cob_v012881 [Colletotrichum orbiculare MAFF 240422]|uniref:Uncharacterized protein n=1 Tax=Colletotrichum orbiculare (strain 104-T / ATCC 96160 / CBS 514.97 / LARS 414 / MAFF 240422) TaxID=1213857 RepID=N4UNY4_COLOR|nr:hypothetical protein Cob_v012881 [Colletotrichum orbiculare MAFF 240422]
MVDASYDCDPDTTTLKTTGVAATTTMDIDEKNTAFTEAQIPIAAPPPNPRRHTINTMMTTTLIPEPTPTAPEPQRRLSWLPRSVTPSPRSATFRRRTPSPFDADDNDDPYSDTNPFGEDFREQSELAAAHGRFREEYDDDDDYDGHNPFEDCEYELPPPPGQKRDGPWTKLKKAMSPKRAISKWRYRKVKHGSDGADEPDHGDPHGQVS